MQKLHQQDVENRSWEQLRNDPEIRTALDKLDKPRFKSDVERCSEALTTYYNFEHYRRSLQGLKARQTALRPDTEAMYARRLGEATEAYKSFIAAASDMSDAFAQSGVDRILQTRSQAIFADLPNNPHASELHARLRAIGIPEADTAEFFAKLRANQWQVLRVPGTDGTFAGAVRAASEHVKTLEGMAAALRQHGVPALEGAFSIPDWLANALIGTALVLFIIVFVL